MKGYYRDQVLGYVGLLLTLLLDHGNILGSLSVQLLGPMQEEGGGGLG